MAISKRRADCAPPLIADVRRQLEMNPLVLLILLLGFPGIGRADSFVVEKQYEVLARILQDKLDELSVDRLLEARRDAAEWHFAFRTHAEKSWVVEVRIALRQKGAHSTDAEVEVVRTEGGMIKTKSKPQPIAASEWTTKVRELLEAT